MKVKLKIFREQRCLTIFKKIFIAPDMSKEQQVVDKELRLKLKEFRKGVEPDAKIKSGKIIKNVDGRKEVVILYRPPK